MANENTKNLEMLKNLVGSTLWKQIVNVFGGGSIYIPSREDFNRDERNKLIRKDWESLIKQGLNNKEADEQIAWKYNLSIDRTRVIRNTRY